jgi:hypothetical protein
MKWTTSRLSSYYLSFPKDFDKINTAKCFLRIMLRLVNRNIMDLDYLWYHLDTSYFCSILIIYKY